MPANVARYFDRRAPQFHSLYSHSNAAAFVFNRIFRAALYRRVELALEAIYASPGCSVLDVGCGSGRNSRLFIAAGAARVVGIDFAPAMIELAQHVCASEVAAGKCELQQGDFTSADLRERFDFVVALGVFDYVRPFIPFLKRMAECSCNKVIASFPCVSLVRAPLRKLRYSARGCPVYFYTRSELQRGCGEAGLHNCKLVPCGSSGVVLIGDVPGSEGRAQSHDQQYLSSAALGNARFRNIYHATALTLHV